MYELPDPAGVDTPPDANRDRVTVRGLPDGPVDLLAGVLHHVDANAIGFLNQDAPPAPLRHTLSLTVGDPEALHVGAELASTQAPGVRAVVVTTGTGAPAREDYDAAERAAAGSYRRAAEAALAVLRAEHALPTDAPPALGEVPINGRYGVGRGAGLVVAHLVLDEFRRRDVRPPRSGEQWFWHLDEQETPQYTAMEALVRDVVDAAEAMGRCAMRGGSLWWLRSLHVHPRCRGTQLGGRLLAHALWQLVRGPLDLVVLDAHPEPTIFAPDPAEPGLADWDAYEEPPRNAVEGLARYFARMGFTRADDEAYGAARLRELARTVLEEPDDRGTSRELGLAEDGPDRADRAIAMYAFAGDLRFRGGPRLGRPVLTRRAR